MQLTQKEMMYLKDAKSQEELCIAKYTNYSQQVSCQQLSGLLRQIAQQEQQHLQTIQQIMQGQMPNVGSGGQQQGGQQSQLSAQDGTSSMTMQSGGSSQGQQAQSGQQLSTPGQNMQMGGSSRGQQLNDRQICEDLLTTEKAVAGLYNTATFEFANPQLRQVLAHIQQEEQNHAYQLYDYMAQKGWYQAQ